MSTQSVSPFEQLINQIKGLPLWVKQVIYAVLKEELEALLSKSTLDMFSADDTLQLWVPDLTPAGRMLMEKPSGNVSPGVYKLIHYVTQGKSAADITMINSWSLEQTSIYLIDAIKAEYVIPPKSGIIQGTLLFLAGQIRLGEYLVKIGRVTVQELDQALRTQKYIEESLGERAGIANVMINLGYINKQDTEGILFLKEESKKTFNISDLGKMMGGGQMIDAQTYERLKNQLTQANQQIRELQMRMQQMQQRPQG